MSKAVHIRGLMVAVLAVTGCILLNGCMAMLGLNVWRVNGEINRTALSAENEVFQRETGINIASVKRGLWSMQNAYRNKMIDLYFNSLMDNRLVFSVDGNQREFAQQEIRDNEEIGVSINNQYQNYSEYEKLIMVIASTSTLALRRDANFKQNEVPDMFFQFIKRYDDGDIPGIVNAQWYKDKNITVTDNGIIID
jgi:hypothetical protein